MQLWPCVVDAGRCLSTAVAIGVKACWWWELNDGSRNLSFREICTQVTVTTPEEPVKE